MTTKYSVINNNKQGHNYNIYNNINTPTTTTTTNNNNIKGTIKKC